MKRYSVDLAAIVVIICFFWGYSTVWSHPVSAHRLPALTSFVGTWTFHDGRLTVNQQGRGAESFRTFVNCTTTLLTACDKFQGNVIYNGGFVTFTLNKIVANTARGLIDNSAYSRAVFTPLTLTYHPARDTLSIRTVIGTGLACGPRAAPGSCGA